MKKFVAAALAACLVTAAVPTSASAHYYHKKMVPAQGKKFGAGSGPWIIIGCAGGVVLAALAANYRDNRELTAEEAWSCGAAFLLSTPKNKKP